MATLISTFSDSTLPINTVDISPTGNSLAAGGDDSMLRLYDLGTGEVSGFSQPDQRITKVAFSPQSGPVVAAHHAHRYNTGGLFLVGSSGPVNTGTMTGHTGKVSWVDFAPDGATVASASLDLTARTWNVETGEQMQVFSGHAAQPGSATSGLWCVRYSPSGNMLATSGSDGTVRLWDVATGKEVRNIPVEEGVVFAVAFSPDGELLAASNASGSIKVFDPTSGALLRSMDGHDGWVVGLEFSTDGSLIASAGYDGTARLWEADSGKPVDVISNGDKVHDVAFSPDGGTLATAGEDGRVNQYSI